MVVHTPFDEKRDALIYYNLFHSIKAMLCITLFTFITVFYGTDNIMWNILHSRLNVKNILQNIVSPIEHYYESK